VPTFQIVVSPNQHEQFCEYNTRRLYFLRGTNFSLEQAHRLARALLIDPVTETYAIRSDDNDEPATAQTFIDVTFLPGVTDGAAESLIQASKLLGVDSLENAATGFRVIFDKPLDENQLRQLARERFANEVIQRYEVNRPISPPFVSSAFGANDIVESIPITKIDDDALIALSHERRLSLDMNEMCVIRDYFQRERREPNDIELETLAQTWSEHCVHKTFAAEIHTERGMIDGLLKSYIRRATEKVNRSWVKSAFVDNAGVIAFDDEWDIAFKVETHNHPSALEPFGGANTGVGGVIRDVLGVGAKPIANTDVLCFGQLDSTYLPSGVLPPKRIFEGVVKGIEDYGNKMGIPTVNGAILFHAGYTSNPLVFCGCVGLLPNRIARNESLGKAHSGDYIVVIGGRTGRDGLRGATFSSMEMNATTSDIAGSAVQIGHPIHEKQAQEAILIARERGLYHAITDCGAGGFSSAVGEMASGLGATVQLQNALLKYPGLRPWEIWLSEAQERMVLSVSPSDWDALKKICDEQDVEAFVLGVFENSGRLILKYGEREIGNLSIQFLHDGIPRRHLRADLSINASVKPRLSKSVAPRLDIETILLRLLAHPNIRSKEDAVRRFDHEVKGGLAVKPFVGVGNHGPSDATVIVPNTSESTFLARQIGANDSIKGIALSNGICPQYGERDAYAMAWAAVDEAFRNAVAVGADPDRIALLDNFCWGNPNLPDRLGSLVECARGCHDAAIAYHAPFISGKDSLNNEYTDDAGIKHAIPGTLLISALGFVHDVNKTVTMDFKRAGNAIYVIGETRDEMLMSHASFVTGDAFENSSVPMPATDALSTMKCLFRAIQNGWVRACHDCSEGGLAVTLAEMCLAGRLGAEIDLVVGQGSDAFEKSDSYNSYTEILLFSESLCRFVVEVEPRHAQLFENEMRGTACVRAGSVSAEARLTIFGASGDRLLSTSVETLERAWRGAIAPAKTDDHRRMTTDNTSASVARRPPLTSQKTKRVLILHANGTNRDHDVARAIELAGGAPVIARVDHLREKFRLRDFHMIVLPGGFSYGDDLGAGTIWSLDLRERLRDELDAFVKSGRPMLGICNGFQALMKANLFSFDGASDHDCRKMSLSFNERGHFECRWVMLEPNPNSVSIFTQGMTEPIYCPVAHGEGCFVSQDDKTLRLLDAKGMIALRYNGSEYPDNPNGSLSNIAGICNAQGNVLGLMPHPENHIFNWQHPRWHRGERGKNGLPLFVNGLRNG
jgi:phosphoribosylformylglycinamidine synthase